MSFREHAEPTIDLLTATNSRGERPISTAHFDRNNLAYLSLVGYGHHARKIHITVPDINTIHITGGLFPRTIKRRTSPLQFWRIHQSFTYVGSFEGGKPKFYNTVAFTTRRRVEA